MQFLNLKILFFIIAHFIGFSIEEQQPSPNEFLQYFSIAAGINSLIFSLSNTIFSIKNLNKLKKKNRGFSEGINESINRSKEHKLKKQITNDQAYSLISTEQSHLLNEQLDVNQTNFTQLIIQSSKLAEIYMVKDNLSIGQSNNTDSELNASNSIIEYSINRFFSSNNSKIENTNNTIAQNFDFNTNKKFRGLVIE
ncbi:Uncharacterized protein cmbei_4002440 [Cryptosporidium meleagridis]